MKIKKMKIRFKTNSVLWIEKFNQKDLDFYLSENLVDFKPFEQNKNKGWRK